MLSISRIFHVCGFLVVLTGTLAVSAAFGQDKIIPLPAQETQANYGLFVGISDFLDKSLAPLTNNVNDAISLAHCFAKTLKLIPLHQVTILVSVEPPANIFRQMLDELKAGGARVVTRTDGGAIRKALEMLASVPNGRTLTIVYFSSHGLEVNQRPHILMSESDPGVGATQLGVDEILQNIDKPEAKVNLLILDACRVQKSGKPGPSETIDMQRFYQEMQLPRPPITLASCSPGETSLPNPDSGMSVFTENVIEALQGEATNPEEEFIRIEHVLRYVSSKTPAAAQKLASSRGVSGFTRQTPWYSTQGEGLRLPLCLSVLAMQQKERRQGRILALRQKLTVANYKFPEVLNMEDRDGIEKALSSWPANVVEALLEKMESLLDPSDAHRVKATVSEWRQLSSRTDLPSVSASYILPEKGSSTNRTAPKSEVPVVAIAIPDNIETTTANTMAQQWMKRLRPCSGAQVNQLLWSVSPMDVRVAGSDAILARFNADYLLLTTFVGGSLDMSAPTQIGRAKGRNQIATAQIQIFILEKKKELQSQIFDGRAVNPLGPSPNTEKDAIKDAFDKALQDPFIPTKLGLMCP